MPCRTHTHKKRTKNVLIVFELCSHEQSKEKNGGVEDHRLSLIVGHFVLKWSDCEHSFVSRSLNYRLTVLFGKSLLKIKIHAQFQIKLMNSEVETVICVSLESKEMPIQRATKERFWNPLTSSTTTDCLKTNSYVKLIYLNSTFGRGIEILI